jgi:hypothetical protein
MLAIVPPTLASRAVDGAIAFTTGAASDLVSTQVAAVAHGVLNGMLLSKANLGVVLILTLSLAIGGAGLVAVTGGKEAGQAQNIAFQKIEKRNRVDAFGDPLPDGAFARLGSTRLRTTGLRAAEILPDGKRIVTLGTTQLRLWEADSGKLLRSNSLGTDLQAMALARDGKTLAAIDESGIILWDIEDWKPLRRFPPLEIHDNGDIDFSPDGKTLVVSQRNGVLRVFDLADGSERKRKLDDMILRVVVESGGRKAIVCG